MSRTGMADERSAPEPGGTAKGGPEARGGAKGATAVLARFATAAREAPPNADAVGRVLQDTVGVAAAGVHADAGRRLLDWLEGEQAPGPATVWGTALTLAPSQAALVNGTTSHALDWDDAAPSMAMHPGAVLLPAVLAQAAAEQAVPGGAAAGPAVSGARLVAAYNIGAAVFRAVSEALPLDFHYERGWHNTSTSGRLAATAALAHLVGLDPEATRHALGIAGSCAAGSLANFGSMTKPLHAGLAARDAVTAIGLARRGFTANPEQLETARGFFAAYGETTPDLLDGLAGRLGFWEHAWVGDWALKRHPSCFATHRAIDAALAVRTELTGPIAQVEVSVPASSMTPLIDHPPTTGLEGKFSLEYTVGRALDAGEVVLADFTDDRVREPGPATAAVTLDLYDGETSPHTTVAVTQADGRRLAHGVDVTYGDARNPLTDADLDAKFTAALTAAGWKHDDPAGYGRRLRTASASPDLAWLQDALRKER